MPRATLRWNMQFPVCRGLHHSQMSSVHEKVKNWLKFISTHALLFLFVCLSKPGIHYSFLLPIWPLWAFGFATSMLVLFAKISQEGKILTHEKFLMANPSGTYIWNSSLLYSQVSIRTISLNGNVLWFGYWKREDNLFPASVWCMVLSALFYFL